MNVNIESYNQGYVVTYVEKDGEFKYVFKCTEEFKLLETIAKRFLKLDIRVVER